MQVFTPKDIAKEPTNKYLAVLVAAKYARVLNDFPTADGTGVSAGGRRT